MDLKEVRETARQKMKGCHVCPECNGKACIGMIPGFGGAAHGTFVYAQYGSPAGIWTGHAQHVRTGRTGYELSDTGTHTEYACTHCARWRDCIECQSRRGPGRGRTGI